MNLQQILQYQKIDMQVYKIEKEYLQMKERENVLRLKNSFIQKNGDLKQLDANLTEALKTLEEVSVKIDAIVAEKLLKVNLDNMQDEQTFNEMFKEITRYDEEITALTKEAEKAIKVINDINYDNKRTNEEMNQINKEYLANEASKKKKEAELAQQLSPLMQQLEALKGEAFDAATFAKYSELRKARRMPVFVPYLDGNCGACGMDVKIEVDKKLIEVGDVVECPHCGRIIFKMK